MNEIKFANLDLLVKKGMNTPWGTADSVEAKAQDKSVIVVRTSSHGGIGVHIPTHPVPEHFMRLGICDDTWAWFEEDDCWPAPALMFPELFPSEQADAESSLRNWHPEAYAAHFGRTPTASESIRVHQAETRERLKNHYTVKTTWGDWAWNVPQGHLYVVGRRESDGEEAGFLIPPAEGFADAFCAPKEDYKKPINEIVLDAYPRWEPDRSLPYIKPRHFNVTQPASGSA